VSDDDVPRLPPARVFGGVAPLIVATASADGVPNVTYLSKAFVVDDRRIALSDQFFGKTLRNLAEVPRASVLVQDPTTGQDWRLTLVHERTERRGPVFEAMRAEIETVAAMTGMGDVFKLRSAQIYRVEAVEDATGRPELLPEDAQDPRDDGPSMADVGELSARLARCSDLDTLVSMAVDGVAGLLGYEHALLLLLDETRERLFTIASAGYDVEGVGSEVAVGDGVIGMAARRVEPVGVGNHMNMANLSRGVRQRYEDEGAIGPGQEIPLPGLTRLQSILAVPAVSLGELVGVLAVEDEVGARYGAADEAALSLVASVLAGAIESLRAEVRVASARAEAAAAGPAPVAVPADAPALRFFAVDGSTFLDGDYLIKGVAGRLLWSLLRQHAENGRTDFTNREVRLDPSLDLPDFRDNFESRLTLLKRRLDEREAPFRIEKTGRGRFRLAVATEVRLEEAPS
jgi:adenylate cyclase